jgi:hypothetical protein
VKASEFILCLFFALAVTSMFVHAIDRTIELEQTEFAARGEK